MFIPLYDDAVFRLLLDDLLIPFFILFFAFMYKVAADAVEENNLTVWAMIILNLDVMLAKRKMRSNELAERIGLTQANLSILKTGKAKAIRLSTLDAICRELQCTPGDILEYREDEKTDWFPVEDVAVRLFLLYLQPQ